MNGKYKKQIGDGVALLIGTPLAAAGMVIFTIPNRLAPGGVSGLATALNALLPLGVGAMSLILNLPIFLLAWRRFGWRKLLLTMIAAAGFSVLLDVFTPLLPSYTGNRLLASVYGGVMLGAGVGMLLTRGVTTGGTDLLSMLVHRRLPQVSTGTLLICLDGLVVLTAVLIFRDMEVALYSAITIFIQGKIIDAMMAGLDFAKVIYIVTDDPAPILTGLVNEQGRGVTEFAAKGGYTRAPKSVLMTVARRNEVAAVMRLAKAADPAAFIILQNAAEVHGEGFKEAQV